VYQKQIKPDPYSLQGEYAGFVSRFIAFLIDIIVVIITLAVVGGTTSLLIEFFGLSDLLDQLENSISITGSILRALTAFWGITTISFLYITLAWTVTSGKSIGKGLMGLRIVPLNGRRLTFLWAVWRYIGFWLSVFALGLGVLWILASDRRQGWHDKMARTCVIYDWPAREDERTVETLQRRWQYLKHTRSRLRGRHKEERIETSSN
jgi:uncharacterized RDD family membrane protein YckC